MTPSTPKSVLTLPTLASGLYIFEASFDDHLAKKFYVIYWPEDTTWDDNAAPAVVKNRVTFMRYCLRNYSSYSGLYTFVPDTLPN